MQRFQAQQCNKARLQADNKGVRILLKSNTLRHFNVWLCALRFLKHQAAFGIHLFCSILNNYFLFHFLFYFTKTRHCAIILINVKYSTIMAKASSSISVALLTPFIHFSSHQQSPPSSIITPSLLISQSDGLSKAEGHRNVSFAPPPPWLAHPHSFCASHKNEYITFFLPPVVSFFDYSTYIILFGQTPCTGVT